MREGRRDNRRILLTITAAKQQQLLHIHHSAFVTVDSWTNRELIERKKDAVGKWLKRSNVVQWTEHVDTLVVSLHDSLVSL